MEATCIRKRTRARISNSYASKLMEWLGGTLYADVVLPVTYVQENEDIIAWHNYVVYNAPAIPAMYEAKSDMQIVYDLANMLGVMSKLAPGRTGVYQTDLQVLARERLREHQPGRIHGSERTTNDVRSIQAGWLCSVRHP